MALGKAVLNDFYFATRAPPEIMFTKFRFFFFEFEAKTTGSNVLKPRRFRLMNSSERLVDTNV